jgi:hypothetical protein
MTGQVLQRLAPQSGRDGVARCQWLRGRRGSRRRAPTHGGSLREALAARRTPVSARPRSESATMAARPALVNGSSRARAIPGNGRDPLAATPMLQEIEAGIQDRSAGLEPRVPGTHISYRASCGALAPPFPKGLAPTLSHLTATLQLDCSDDRLESRAARFRRHTMNRSMRPMSQWRQMPRRANAGNARQHL